MHLDLLCIKIHNHVDWLMWLLRILENIQILSGSIRHFHKNELCNINVTQT